MFPTIETEHKYLVAGSYKHLSEGHTHIVQGYLNDDPNRTVRIRIRAEKAYITIKGASSEDGLSRYEWEKEIPIDDAKKLLQLCLPGVIDKDRWIVWWEGHRWEVDEFHGDLDGFQMAELEVGNPEEQFSLPPFVGKEVTGDARYYNSSLRRLNHKPQD